MKKKLLEKFEEVLKKERLKIVNELGKFAKKEKNREDWTAQFPKFNGETSLERFADEVEEYTWRLSLEFNLEKRLKEIDSALEKIKKGTFGICEKCQKEIETERLKANPAAKVCLKCKNAS
jgi:DnaK suppressor protein